MLRLTKLSLLFLVSGLLFITPVSAAEDLGPRKMSPGLKEVETKDSYFGPDPQYDDKPYSPEAQYKIYGGKRALRTPRPIFELFRPLYSEGDYTNTSDAVGGTNLFEPQFTMFGDFRTAVAHNSNGENKDVTQIAARLNLNLDLKSNEIMINELSKNMNIKYIISEENEEIININIEGNYLVTFDPLDGSSNIDVNVSVY